MVFVQYRSDEIISFENLDEDFFLPIHLTISPQRSESWLASHDPCLRHKIFILRPNLTYLLNSISSFRKALWNWLVGGPNLQNSTPWISLSAKRGILQDIFLRSQTSEVFNWIFLLGWDEIHIVLRVTSDRSRRHDLKEYGKGLHMSH